MRILIDRGPLIALGLPMKVDIELPDGTTGTGTARVSIVGDYSSAALGEPADTDTGYNEFTASAHLSSDSLGPRWSTDEALAELREMYTVIDVPTAYSSRIQLATLKVEQVVRSLHIGGGKWAWALDVVSGDLMEAGVRVDELIEDEDRWEGVPRYNGALYYLKRLDTHPGCRGQMIGLHLIAHTLRTIGTSMDDLAMLTARPGGGPWEDAEAHPEVDVDRLVRHYGKLGFERTGHGSDEHVLMEFPMGTSKFPPPFGAE